MLFVLDGVNYTRAGRTVLSGLGAELPAGTSAIVGPSGAGKSTLLRLLNRLADPGPGTSARRSPVRARGRTAAQHAARPPSMIAAIHLTLGQVAATLALIAVAALVSIWQRADLERDIAIATVRSFVQLTAIGYVIKLIFDQNRLVFVIALVCAMVLFGAVTARHRARRVPNAFLPLLIALALAGSSTLALIVALGVFKAQARYLVPIGGMVVGNSMTAAAVALNRLGEDGGDAGEPRDAGGAMRRTHLANERTYLAWWRTGLTALASGVGIGRLVPSLAHQTRWPYAILGAGFALIGIVAIAYGLVRQRAVRD